MTRLDEGETTCCDVRGFKHWITDSQGIPREKFQ